MKSESELKKLYDLQLKDKLQLLENDRKSILNRYFLCLLFLVILVAANFFLFQLHPATILIILSVLASVSFIIYYIYQTIAKQNNYRNLFKSGVVTELVRSIDSDWKYIFNSYISEENYHQSGIFPQHYDRYRGDDFVGGEIDRTDFQFSELQTEVKRVTHDSKGRRQEHWETIFKGLFMHADFNKEFRGTTYVLPDTAERLFGRFGQTLQKMSSRGELVKLENPEFEKMFVVYSSDQVESRYILTPVMMEAMVRFSRQFRKSISFSFVGSRVYCAMSFSSDLFEPKIFRSGVNYENIREMYDLFGIIETLIQELNLNTRIWTKD